MNVSLLDNPVWHALNSHHAHFAIRGEEAVRYPPDVFPAAAMLEHSSPGFTNLKDLVAPNEIVGVFGAPPGDLSGWEVIFIAQVTQLIPENLKLARQVDAVVLTAEDMPEMLDLEKLTLNGAFPPRVMELGEHLGVRQDGRLVAMAGQRYHLPGFCEVSTVCTHPDYRRCGYGTALTTMVAESILERQETPFLHVAPDNDHALQLYQKMGFRIRREIQLSVLKRLAN